MAKCERHDPLPVKQPPPKYTLTLSQDEAQFLVDLVGRCVIGTGRREIGDHLFHAFGAAGVHCGPIYDSMGQVEFYKVSSLHV